MKIKKTGYDTFVNIICLGLLLGISIYLGVYWSYIPDKVPGHYNGAGIVDRWGNKEELLILPIIAGVLFFFITILEQFPNIWNTGIKVTEENRERVYRILKNMIKTEKLVVVAVFCFITIYSSQAWELPLLFLPVFLCLMFGSLLFFILKLVKM